MIVNTAELNSLVNGLLPFAQHMLQEHDAFLPFAAIVKSGEIVMLAAGLEDPNAPVPQRLDNIRKALSRHASNAGCSAVAYCVLIKLSDLRDGTATDAVQIAFEHRSGEALDVVFTYTKTGDGVDFAQPMVRLAEGGLFAVPAGSFVN